MMSRIPLLSILLLFPLALSAQTTDVVRQINWQTGFLEITIEKDVDESRGATPANLFRTQQAIEREFSHILFESILPLQVDSLQTVEDMVRRNPAISSRITELVNSTERGLPQPRADLSGLRQQFRVPIFPDLTEIFVTHQIPFRQERVINWVPTEEFTGVIIYAGHQLPHRGTGQETFLEPALLPEIYDTNLRPVLEQDMLIPSALLRWGVVAYTEDFDEVQWRPRIGANPYRIMAREAFGVMPTDIVIAPEDADRLLSNEHNRRMLREGRILVIVAPGQTIDR